MISGAGLPRIDGFLQLLDGRAFGSIWYWLLLAVAWSLAMRGVLGVPAEVAARAARVDPDGPDDPAALALLDWLSLTLPRWRVGRIEAAVLTAAGTFLVTVIGTLGFWVGLEGAQALTLLAGPLLVLLALRVRLAGRLSRDLAAAQTGAAAPNAAASSAGRACVRHRHVALLLSLVTVAASSAWGTLWTLRHPWG